MGFLHDELEFKCKCDAMRCDAILPPVVCLFHTILERVVSFFEKKKFIFF